MSLAESIAHHALLALAVAALGRAGWRVAGAAGAQGLERVVGAAVLGAAVAVLEALVLGLAGLGGSALALGAAALLAAGAAERWGPSPPQGGGIAAPLAAAARLGSAERSALGAAAGALGAWALWALLHPALGLDMVVYHLPEAIVWVQEGSPGTVERVWETLPVGNYPLTHEVLLSWGMALGRSFAWVWLVTAAVPLLVAVGGWCGLRRAGAPRLAAGLGVAALVALPAVIASQSGGATTDPAALAWLLCCAALCAAARERPALLSPAIVAAGLAIGTKTSAAPLTVAALAVAAWPMRQRLRPHARALALAGAGALAVGGYWYARNLVDHGSPFWPFVEAPWGDPAPPAIEGADVSFIERPRETVSRVGHGYLDTFAGALLLVAAALAAPLVRRERAVTAAAVATAASVFIWMNAPHTGVVDNPAFDVGTPDATRYGLPGVAAAVLTVALVARGRDTPAWAARGVLALAVLLALENTFDLGFPSAPSVTTPLAGALLGAAAALAAGPLLGRLASWLRARASRRVPLIPGPLAERAAGPLLARRARSARLSRGPLAWGLAAVLVVAAGVAGAVAGDGFVERHADAAAPSSGVAGWLAGRAQWRDGSEPVASTSTMVAPLAGDHLEHELELVRPHESCARVRSRDAWIVVDVPTRRVYDSARCLDPGRPGYADRYYRAFAPGSAGPP